MTSGTGRRGSRERPLVVNPTLRVGLDFSIAVPGRGVERVRLGVEDAPELVAAIFQCAIASGDLSLEVDGTTLQNLEALGVLVPEGSASRPEFYVDARAEIRDLVPAPAARVGGAPRGDLVRTSGLVEQRGDEAPPGLEDALPDVADGRRPLWWIPDARTAHRRPVWPSRRAQNGLRALEAGKRVSAEALEELVLLGAVVAAETPTPVGLAPDLTDERGRLAREGYAVLRQVMSPLQVAALRDYVRRLRAAGAFDRERQGQQVEGRLFIHQEPVARALHGQMASLINELTPEQVKPSYSYLATYARDSVLRRHVDRAQCAWNISLAIDVEPESSLEDPWPIWLETSPGKPSSVALGLGDAVLYRGTTVPHWREPLTQHDLYTACFFHFVPHDFEGSLR